MNSICKECEKWKAEAKRWRERAFKRGKMIEDLEEKVDILENKITNLTYPQMKLPNK